MNNLTDGTKARHATSYVAPTFKGHASKPVGPGLLTKDHLKQLVAAMVG
jgi:hypothetical protein